MFIKLKTTILIKLSTVLTDGLSPFIYFRELKNNYWKCH
jgi:hypothetical protein